MRAARKICNLRSIACYVWNQERSTSVQQRLINHSERRFKMTRGTYTSALNGPVQHTLHWAKNPALNCPVHTLKQSCNSFWTWHIDLLSFYIIMSWTQVPSINPALTARGLQLYSKYFLQFPTSHSLLVYIPHTYIHNGHCLNSFWRHE